jgi:hypothetical protein
MKFSIFYTYRLGKDVLLRKVFWDPQKMIVYEYAGDDWKIAIKDVIFNLTHIWTGRQKINKSLWN